MITQERLKELLEYNQDTGIFVWKSRPSWMFRSARSKKAWHSKHYGKQALNKRTDGYIAIKVDVKTYRAHRLAWLYVYGEWPNGEIDHKNHIRDDNRMCNLRDVTRSENQKNASIRKDNTSEVTGVSWYKTYEKWVVQIVLSGNKTTLGYFNDKFEAICCRKSADNKYGFHENHGAIAHG